MVILKMLNNIIKMIKEKIQKKLRKKFRKKLKKLIRRLVCLALVCIGLSMLYKYRRPILSAMIKRKLPLKKCPMLKKR